jgi:hypothetical protein
MFQIISAVVIFVVGFLAGVFVGRKHVATVNAVVTDATAVASVASAVKADVAKL